MMEKSFKQLWKGWKILPKIMIIISRSAKALRTSISFTLLFFISFQYQKKLKLWRLPKYKILWKDGMPTPLAHLYRCEGRTLGKTYAITARCYWKHPWGTHREPMEHIGNPLGTWRNKGKLKPPSPKHLEKTNQGTLSACCAFPFAAWNFYFQNCSSPFLAWANTPIINWKYLYIGYYYTYLMKAKRQFLDPIYPTLTRVVWKFQKGPTTDSRV
jgi:hypothetical protein